jgi:hypothetical protein
LVIESDPDPATAACAPTVIHVDGNAPAPVRPSHQSYCVAESGDNEKWPRFRWHSYQYTWIPMLQAGSGCTPGGLPGRGEQWLKAFAGQIPGLLKHAAELDFRFVAGQRPQPNKNGHIPTTMEWARKLSADDLKVLASKAPYSERVPDVDEGFTQADLKDAKRAQAVTKVIVVSSQPDNPRQLVPSRQSSRCLRPGPQA